MNIFTGTESKLVDLENNLRVTEGKGGGEIDWKFKN